MSKYWIKILLSALLIFGVGFTLYATGRSMVRHVDSDQDITIPLLSVIPLNLNGERLGGLRSLTIQRSAPKEVIGFKLRARVNDAAALERFRSCHLSISNPEQIDEHTTFFCLASDSGYQVFGEVRLELRLEGGDVQTIVQPLLLPDSMVLHIRNKGPDRSGAQDSMAAEVRDRVRAQSRSIADSLRAVSLEEKAKQMQEQADSIRRARAGKPPTP